MPPIHVLRLAALVSLGLSTSSQLRAQSHDSTIHHHDHPVQGGGVFPEGWSVRPDEEGSVKSVKFGVMEPGYHVTLGPAAILYRASDRAEGPFHTLATFQQTRKTEDPEGYGIFFGGQDLSGKGQRYTYFLVRGDGKYLIKQRAGEKTTEITRGWIESPAVTKVGPTGSAKNLLEIDAKADPSKVSFKVNGTTVYAADAKALPLKGIVGLRVNHTLDVHVNGFALHQ